MSESIGFTKRSIKNKFARKRKQSSDEEEKKNSSDEDENTSVVNKNGKPKFNPNVFSSSKLRKTQKTKGSDDSDKSSDEDVVVRYKSRRSAMPEGP